LMHFAVNANVPGFLAAAGPAGVWSVYRLILGARAQQWDDRITPPLAEWPQFGRFLLEVCLQAHFVGLPLVACLVTMRHDNHEDGLDGRLHAVTTFGVRADGEVEKLFDLNDLARAAHSAPEVLVDDFEIRMRMEALRDWARRRDSGAT
jgi:hypothetical protein